MNVFASSRELSLSFALGSFAASSCGSFGRTSLLGLAVLANFAGADASDARM